MKHNKLYSALVISLGLALSGCGDEGGGDTNPTTTPATPTTTSTLSIANPIEDIIIENAEELNFTIPSNLCSDSTGADIDYGIRAVSGNVGFEIHNSIQLVGAPDTTGIVSVDVECYTDSNRLTDSFTVTVEHFDKDMVVTATAPSFAENNDLVYLEADAKYFSAYDNVSYLWEETSGLGLELKDNDRSRARIVIPEVLTSNTIATFKVTVTDDDGSIVNTATGSVAIELIADNAPEVSLSFPLAIGQYNDDNVDVFGNVEATDGDAVASVIVTVDDTDYTASIFGDTWRVEDVPLTDTTNIKVKVISDNGLVNYNESDLLNGTLFETAIDKNITDIAVLDNNDRMYLQVSANVGDLTTESKISRFDFSGNITNNLSKNHSENFEFSTSLPTSMSFADSVFNVLVSYPTGVSKVSLFNGFETVLSAEGTGTGAVPGFILDLAYNTDSNTLYAADANNRTISTIDQSSGDRVEIVDSLNALLSIAVNSTTGDLYFSQGLTTTGQAVMKKYDGSSITTIYDIAAGDEGGPISDLAINEASNELFFVDGTGSLLKLDLTTYSLSIVIANLFTVESVTSASTPLIGLHYHSIRNVLIAAGKDADGTNKLLVIDPVTGDYAKIATGTVD